MSDTPKQTPSGAPLKPLLWVAVGVVGTVLAIFAINGVPQGLKDALETQAQKEQRLAEDKRQTELRLAEEQRQTDEALLQSGQWRDPATNLIWTRCSLGQTWNGSGCNGEAKKINWWDAHQAALNHREGGHSDWRLPTAQELASLLAGTVQKGKVGYILMYKQMFKLDDGERRWSDLSGTQQKDNQQSFFYSGQEGYVSPKLEKPSTDDFISRYWSSSTVEGTSGVWFVDFADGYMGQHGGDYVNYPDGSYPAVRLVRASQSLDGGNVALLSFEQQAKNIYQDPAYLQWQENKQQEDAHRQAEIERQQRACNHVYVGKQFEAQGGFLGLTRHYIVVGVSPQSQQVTIRSRNSDYRQEITCSDVPH